VSSNFDHIAPYYNLLAKLVFGNSIHKAQLQFLDEIAPNSDVLVIGGGSGKFLRDLLLRCKVRRILYVESSAEMIRASKKAISGIKQSACVEFLTGTEADIPADTFFDVVITHCFLNVFHGEELRNLVKELLAHLKPGGLWLFSDFRISSHWFHRIWQRGLISLMYCFFRVTAGLKNKTLENFDKLLGSMKLIKLEEKFFHGGMINSVCYRKE
jgi:tRNA (cmo5U34)-methyltransferase